MKPKFSLPDRLKRVFSPIVRLVDKILADNINIYASHTTFFLILSLFPMAMLVLTMVRYLPFTQEELMSLSVDILPSAVHDLIDNTLREIYSKTPTTIISVTVVTALFSASSGMMALRKGLNAVYNSRETRNYVILRVQAVLYTLVFLLLLLLMLCVLVFGNSFAKIITENLPAAVDAALLVISMRTAVSFGVLALFFLLFYRFVPNRRSRFLPELPGALISAGGWICFSYLYSYYIDHIGNFSLYGSLTAVVLLMLWLYFCIYILFVGAEINAFLQSEARDDHPRAKPHAVAESAKRRRR